MRPENYEIAREDLTSKEVADACREVLSEGVYLDIEECDDVEDAVAMAVADLVYDGEEDPVGFLIGKGILLAD